MFTQILHLDESLTWLFSACVFIYIHKFICIWMKIHASPRVDKLLTCWWVQHICLACIESEHVTYADVSFSFNSAVFLPWRVCKDGRHLRSPKLWPKHLYLNQVIGWSQWISPASPHEPGGKIQIKMAALVSQKLLSHFCTMGELFLSVVCTCRC